MPLAIVIAAAIIGGAITLAPHAAPAGVAAAPDKLDLVADISKTDFIRGDENADVTVIEYADFSCHYCAQYHPTMQKLIAAYPGRVRWVYRHLPIFNMEAAIASECVGDLAGDDAFWHFADTLFAHQDSFSTAFYRETALVSGVSGSDYDACIANILTKSAIERDFRQARTLLGFNATPYTILIDKAGRKYSFAGALPFADLQTSVETLLSK